MTTETVTVSLDSVFDAMRVCYRNALTRGRNWHAVTVGTDGEPYAREEASECCSVAEYYRKGRPHPVTVWSTRGDGGSMLDENEIEAEMDAFDPEEQFAGEGGIPELTGRLEEAGFTVE